MIVVTGATGQLGQLIVERLVQRVPAERVGASTRDPAKADALAALGVRVRRGDFADPDSLKGAFEGAEQVLIVSSNASAQGGDPIAQHRAAIDAARAAGARRIVYTSQIAAAAASAFPPARDHATTEAMLAESGLAWTALRNGFYGSSGLGILRQQHAMDTGTLAAPEDGKVSWTAHEDLAEAAAAILADEGRFDGPTPPLTATEALDLGDLCAIVSEVTGKPVERTFVSDDALRATMRERGLPDSVVALAAGLYVAARAGEFAAVDPTLPDLLGRAPITMRELVVRTLAQPSDGN